MWHNHGVTADGEAEERRSRKRAPRPLTADLLSELALHYVSRFATTRSKLVAYLRRKLRERGWDGDGDPQPESLADRLTELGYIDDEAFAVARAGSLTRRGFGEGRVRQALRHAGVGEEDSVRARELASEQAAEAALRFAQRKRIGPYAVAPADPRARDKALAAMIRAGHGFGLSRQVVDAKPGEELTPEQLVQNI